VNSELYKAEWDSDRKSARGGGGVVRATAFDGGGGANRYKCLRGCKGPQAVPACPSGKGTFKSR
jgi:hypothetical protein